MKKYYLVIILIIFLVNSGCSNNNEIKLQAEIIEKNNKIIELQEELKKEKVETKEIKNLEDDSFEKKQDCIKYKQSIQDKYPGTSINIFYSKNQETCIAEVVRIENGNISNQILSDVFSNTIFAHLSKNNDLIYDKKEFGLGQTYNSIKTILKGE